ncbi:MAG: DUF1517 domain-containing protein [Myxococcales bacterium]|nr:DUF1517 domain-containing protein [Myxococcales bacterium]
MHPDFVLRRLSLAFDFTARASLQAALGALGASVDLGSGEGRRAALGSALALASRAVSGLVGAAASSEWLTAAEAPQRFEALATSLRGRYVVETARNGVETPVSLAPPRADEGDGYLVVTLLVALDAPFAEGEFALTSRAAAPDLMRVLAVDGGEVVALEVIWSPTKEADRMSPDELRTHYPEVLRLDDVAAWPLCAEARA